MFFYIQSKTKHCKYLSLFRMTFRNSYLHIISLFFLHLACAAVHSQHLQHIQIALILIGVKAKLIMFYKPIE